MSIQNFEILSKIGKGSFGNVYKVRRRKDGQIYAMKKVNITTLSQKEINNALNEIRIIASIKSPYIISYKESFYSYEANSLYMITEYFDDGDLEKKIKCFSKSNLSFSEAEIWNLFSQIVKGVKSLHDNKIMHRDLKSANVFLMKNNRCKIGDMNVSKLNKEGIANTRTGTPYYASPEIWKEMSYGFKSDIWALGCVLYEMCMLTPPFTGKTVEEVFSKICKGLYKPLHSRFSNYMKIMIGALLRIEPHMRPDIESVYKWINSSCIRSLTGDYSKETSVGDFNLIDTLRFSSAFNINEVLPKPRYDITTKRNVKSACGVKKKKEISPKCSEITKNPNQKRNNKKKILLPINTSLSNNHSKKKYFSQNQSPPAVPSTQNTQSIQNKQSIDYTLITSNNRLTRNVSYYKHLQMSPTTTTNITNISTTSNKSTNPLDGIQLKESDAVKSINLLRHRKIHKRILSAIPTDTSISPHHKLILPMVPTRNIIPHVIPEIND